MTDKLFKIGSQPGWLPDDDQDFLAVDDRYESEARYEEDDVLPLSETMPRSDPLSFIDEQQRKLALALDFGPDDLMLNGEGKLSPVQIALLDKDLFWSFGPMIAVCVALALVFAVAAVFVSGEMMLLPSIPSLMAALAAALMFKRTRDLLPEFPVQRTTLRLGTLSLTARRWGFSDDDKLPVPNHQPIFAPKHLYKALQANRTYILYYTQVRTWRGYRLLSLEPAEDTVEFEKPKRKPKRG